MIKLMSYEIFEHYCDVHGTPAMDFSYTRDPKKQNGIIIILKNGLVINYSIDLENPKEDIEIYNPKQKKYRFKQSMDTLAYTQAEILNKYCDNIKECQFGCPFYKQFQFCKKYLSAETQENMIKKLIDDNIIEEVN